MKLYSSSEMAEELGIEIQTFYKRCVREKILPIEKKASINYFYRKQFFPKVVKYYPMKTTETFYIYESKINKK